MTDIQDNMTLPEVVDAEHPNTLALASLAEGLAERKVAPDGDYPIVATALGLIDSLTAERDEALAAVVKAKAAASASKGKAPAKARKICADAVKNPIVASGEGDDAISREQAVLLAIGEAETVEVVLSNGRTEILEVSPFAIHGDAWRVSMVGLQLTIPELIVHGPAPGRGAYALNGYGLLLDGELRAYMARGDQLNIAGGSNNNVAPDIVF